MQVSSVHAQSQRQADGAMVHTPLSAEQLLQLQAELLGRKPFREAATALSQQLASSFKCARASIGWQEKAGIKVVAASYAAEVHVHQEAARLVAAAMEEAVDQGVRLVYPEPETGRPHILRAQEELARRQGYAVCTVPLIYGREIVGALTLERHDQEFAAAEAAHIERVATMMAAPLALKFENGQSPWRRLLAGARSSLRYLPGPDQPARKFIIAGLVAGLLMLALVLLVPTTYYVQAPARLEGVVQRALSAPADGYLQQVYARPGDHVKAGQVLAELADQDLRVEQRGLQGELAQHENALIAAQARSDRTEFIASQGRAEALHARLDLIQQQLDRSQLRAPFDGIIIKGDLSQSIGAPVERGAELITMAPDTGYRVMIEAEESEIGDIEVGQTGRLVLAAMPGQTLSLRVERITPLASTEEGRHYFPVFAILEGEPPALRPGMQGYAKIEVDQRPLLFNWGRRTLNWLRIALWSWGA